MKKEKKIMLAGFDWNGQVGKKNDNELNCSRRKREKKCAIFVAAYKHTHTLNNILADDLSGQLVFN